MKRLERIVLLKEEQRIEWRNWELGGFGEKSRIGQTVGVYQDVYVSLHFPGSLAAKARAFGMWAK